MAASNGHAGTLDLEGGADAVAVEQLMERIAELELYQDAEGWETLTAGSSDLDFDRDFLRRVIRLAQVMYLKNPLIDHAVSVMGHYVMAQGVTIQGVGVANDRVQAFLADPHNRRTFSGAKARIQNDRQLSYEGNVFLALFSPRKEVTQVRRIPTLQVVDGDIISDPEDDEDVWLYCRVRSVSGKRVVTYHPSLMRKDGLPKRGRPKGTSLANKPQAWGVGEMRGEVLWDAPVVHVSDGGLTGAKFGVPTIYSSMDWAKSVSRDLSDYATIRRALARFAWKFTAKSRATATAMRERLDSTVSLTNPREQNPPPETASAAILTEGNDLAPLRTSGATPNPEEGRRLWLMVSAGTGIPETILAGNSDVGNYATAKTLDRPTELMMEARQDVWQEAIVDIVGYDLERAAADRLLPPTDTDPETGETGPTELVPDVIFPDVLEADVGDRVGAVVTAATLDGKSKAGTMPDETLSRLLLVALGVDDVDEVLEALADLDDDTQDPDLDPDAPPTEVEFREALDAFTDKLRHHADRRRARHPGAGSGSDGEAAS